MSASQVLNAPSCYTALAPNDGLPDLNFCNQSKPWKFIILNLLLKTFIQLVDARKTGFVPTVVGLGLGDPRQD